MRSADLALLVLGAVTITDLGAAAEGRVVTSERGSCIEGPHEPLRVRRLPGTAVSSSKPRNPLDDSYVHCEETFPSSTRAAPGSPRPR